MDQLTNQALIIGGIIHIIVKMNSVPSYVLFHDEHVKYAKPISLYKILK